MADRTAPVTEIPMHGMPCTKCGRPVSHLEPGATERLAVHVDPRVSPCHMPNPPLTAADRRAIAEDVRAERLADAMSGENER